MKRRKGTLIIVLFFILVYFTFQLFSFFRIDKCLDNGGSWDEEKCKCEYE